ncbi:hypothetical protein DFQ27_000204, partial [Actinomortierella ambigua]
TRFSPSLTSQLKQTQVVVSAMLECSSQGAKTKILYYEDSTFDASCTWLTEPPARTRVITWWNGTTSTARIILANSVYGEDVTVSARGEITEGLYVGYQFTQFVMYRTSDIKNCQGDGFEGHTSYTSITMAA